MDVKGMFRQILSIVLVSTCIRVLETVEVGHAFLGGSLRIDVNTDEDGVMTADVHLITSWLIGQGPCGQQCSISDVGMSTNDSRIQQERAHSNQHYFGNLTYVYRDGEHNQESVLGATINASDAESGAESDISIWEWSAHVVAVDEDEGVEQEELTFHFQLNSNATNDTSEAGFPRREQVWFDGASQPHLLFQDVDSRWHLGSTFIVGTRNDTGQPNRSPQVKIQPFYRVKLNTTTDIRIHVTDEDGDDVRCHEALYVDAPYWHRPAGVTVTKNCTVEVEAVEEMGYKNDSWTVVHVLVADYSTTDVEIDGRLYKPTVRISHVAIQIAIHILDYEEITWFVDHTVTNGNTSGNTMDGNTDGNADGNMTDGDVTVYVGELWQATVFAQSNSKTPIAFILTEQTPGTVMMADVEADSTSPGVYYTTVKWRPGSGDVGSNLICLVAVDEYGTKSDTEKCFTVIVKVEDPCDTGPCVRGTCFSQLMLGQFFCLCPVGYTGQHCEIDIDECEREPCTPGSTERCVSGENNFTCICLPGYEGQLCDIETDECQSTPCQNNGTCTDAFNNYFCDCPMGFAGPNCADDQGPRCFACTNIRTMEECTAVTTCESTQMCITERLTDKQGNFNYNLGCQHNLVCSGVDADVIDDVCTQCCHGDYCNAQGCHTLKGIKQQPERGPICYDCDDVEDMSACKTVEICDIDEICTMYGSQYTKYDSKCYSKDYPCGNDEMSASGFLCHSCCSSDFCNTDCSQTPHQAAPEIVG